MGLKTPHGISSISIVCCGAILYAWPLPDLSTHNVEFLYERIDKSNILSRFVVGRPGPEYGLPVAVLYERVDTPNIFSCFVVDRPRPEYGLPVAVI